MKIAKNCNLLQDLLAGNVTFVIDGLFFPEYSHLILAVWYALVEEKIVARGDFISSVSEEYRYLYAAELCGTLLIMIFTNAILSRYPHLSAALITKIGSDCQSVINLIWNTSLVITFNKHMY